MSFFARPKLSSALRRRIMSPRSFSHASSSLFRTCAFGTILARINRVCLDVEARLNRLRASVGDSPEKARIGEKTSGHDPWPEVLEPGQPLDVVFRVT